MSLRRRLQDFLGLHRVTDSYENGVYEEIDGYPESLELSSEYEESVSDRSALESNNVISMPGVSAFHSELVIMEPYSFQEVPAALIALRDRKVVVLNLGNMDAEEAQRSVDYVAGGTFALNGNQERIGKCVFLFTPHSVQITSQATAMATEAVQNGYSSSLHAQASTHPGSLHNEQDMLRKLEIRAGYTSRSDAPPSF